MMARYIGIWEPTIHTKYLTEFPWYYWREKLYWLYNFSVLLTCQVELLPEKDNNAKVFLFILIIAFYCRVGGIVGGQVVRSGF